MNINSETEVLKVLGINSWSEMTSAQLPQLMRLTPKIDKDVAMSILPQLTGSIPAEGFAALKEVVMANDRGQDRQHEVDLKSLEIYSVALSQAESEEERAEIRNDIREVRQDKLRKDTENKEFWLEISTKVLSVVAVALVGGLTVSGAAQSKKV